MWSGTWPIWQLRAIIADDDGEADSAVAQLQELVQRRDDMSFSLFQDVVLQLAHIHERHHRWTEAADTMVIARDTSDNDVDIVRRHVILLDKAGKREEFREALGRLLTMAPSKPAPSKKKEKELAPSKTGPSKKKKELEMGPSKPGLLRKKKKELEGRFPSESPSP